MEGEEPFLVISLHLLEIYPCRSKKVKKRKLGGREEIKVWNTHICYYGILLIVGWETLLTPFLSMFGLGNPNSSSVFGRFELGFVVCLI